MSRLDDRGRGEVAPIDPGKLAARMTTFFGQTEQYLRGPISGTSSSPQVSSESLRAALAQLSGPLRCVQEARCANVWATAGLGNDEVRVCSVLAKLWDSNHYGNEARSFLQRCLNSLNTPDLPDMFELSEGYEVQTEHCPNANYADRVDITLETKRSVVGIEVKINAAEGDRQLERYVETMAQRAALTRRTNAKVIYLSARRPIDRSVQASWLTWRQVADAAALADALSPAGVIIRDFGEFCRHLGE